MTSVLLETEERAAKGNSSEGSESVYWFNKGEFNR